MSCDYQSILALARCFECIPPGAQFGIQTKLMQDISGFSGDVNQLMSAARCIATCIPGGMLEEVKTNLLCEVVDSIGTTVKTVCDSDALKFISAASITVQSQKDAICELVASLKNNGTPPFWDSEIIIYPFVGGSANQHSYNLKDPSQYRLTYAGAAVPTHDQFGMSGTGNGYASTNYVPRVGPPAMLSTQGRIYSYLYVKDPAAGKYHWGALSDASANRTSAATTAGGTVLMGIHEGGVVSTTHTENGGYIIMTPNGLSRQLGFNGLPLVSPGYANLNTSNSVMILLARNINAVPPAVAPFDYSTTTICGFSMGSRALSSTEWPIYNQIWQNFQTEMGRQRP